MCLFSYGSKRHTVKPPVSDHLKYKELMVLFWEVIAH